MSKIKGLKAKSEQEAAKLLSLLVNGLKSIDSSFEPYLKDNGSWVLDTGNNWFATIRQGDRGYDVDLRYRYRTPESHSALEGLAVFMAWRFGGN